MLYLDNASTTSVNKEVLDIFNKLTLELVGNPSSNHKLGFLASQYNQKAIRQILKQLNCQDNKLIFTSGSSEANNLLIKGIAYRNRSFSNVLITSKVEHASCLEVFYQLEKEGFKVIYLDVDLQGKLNINQLKEALKLNPSLVCIMSTNNEVGNNFPIETISDIIHQNSKAYFISDITQGIGKVKIDFSKLDGFTMSSHKIHGLKSSGFCCIKPNVKINPEILGGHQQDGLRAGTINAPLNCSLATALRLYFASMDTRKENVIKLYNHLYDELNQLKEDVVINSCKENTSYYILNFSLLKHKASVVVEDLSSKDIFVSTQSACSSKKAAFSYVLDNMGFNKEISSNSIRVSFKGDETIEDIDMFISNLKEEFKNLAERG